MNRNTRTLVGLGAVIGCMLALMNHMQARAARRSGRALPAPLALDCRHCTICKFGA